MTHMTFILGAGASAEGGCPVMSNFLSKTSRLVETGRLQLLQQDHDCLNKVRRELFNNQIKVKFDSSHMENLFSAIDMGLTLGRLGSLSTDEIKAARESFIRLTAATLETTQNFIFHARSFSNNRQHAHLYGPAGYQDLAGFCRAFLKENTGNTVDIITFNYDTGVEATLLLSDIDFSVSGTPGYDNDCQIRLHKLHGSILWSRSDNDAGFVDLLEEYKEYLQMVSDAPDTHFPSVKCEDNQNVKFDFVTRKLKEDPNFSPFIVPPTDDKANQRNAVTEVWACASDAISRADVLSIVGYSLPQTDVFFKCFWAISASRDHELRRIYLVDKSNNNSIKQRYEEIIGEPIRNRIAFTNTGFAAGVKTIMHDLAKSEGTWIFD